MKILLSGYYGFGNIGDEAVLTAIKRGLAVHQIEILPANRLAVRKIISLIRGCDVLVSGGGTLIQNTTSRFGFLYYLSIIFLGNLFRKRVIVLGQGFGPLNGWVSRSLARSVLNRAEQILLRDQLSLEELKRLGVESGKLKLTGDPVGLLNPDSRIDYYPLPAQPRLAIVIRDRPGEDNTRWTESLAQAIDWLSSSKGFQPVFIPFQPQEDDAAVERVRTKLQGPSTVAAGIKDPEEMLSLIARFDLVIGMRLHALIFAALGKVPMLGLSYDPKVEAFLKIIDQPCVDLSGEVSLKSLKNLLEEIILNSERIKSDLGKGRNHLAESAQANFLPFRTSGERLVNDFSGVKVDNVNLVEALGRVREMLESGRPNLIVTPNPEIIVACQHDRELMNIVNGAGLRTPDGISMVVVSKINRRPLKERVSGIDLLLAIVKQFPNRRVFLLGGAPGVAEAAAKKLGSSIVCGTHQGYFSDDQPVIDLIKSARPDILFIGLGAGRQERWGAKYLAELNVPVVMCIGGSLDVISGIKKRAPVIFQKLYIEWLYRLLTEPQRWKRQLALPKFLWLMFKPKRPNG